MFETELHGNQVVPAVNTKAEGEGFVLLNAQQTKITVVLAFESLANRPTSAQIHGPALRGANAPVVFDLGPINSFRRGNGWVGVTNIKTFDITPQQAAQIRGGLWYIDIHSQNRPNGEEVA